MVPWGVRLEHGAPYVALDKSLTTGVEHFNAKGGDVLMLSGTDRRMRLI